MEEEIWKDVKGYEGLYKVSNLGNVKSLNYRQTRMSKNLKPGTGSGYAIVILSKNKITKPFSVHMLVAVNFMNYTKTTRNIVIDHINNIKDDNRLSNLQITTNRINNHKDRKNTTSKYIGVHWDNRVQKWGACIRINNRTKNLGTHIKEKDAAMAYQKELKRWQDEKTKNK